MGLSLLRLRKLNSRLEKPGLIQLASIKRNKDRGHQQSLWTASDVVVATPSDSYRF